MAFISNQERETLVKKTHKGYGGRKAFFFISIALTLAFIVLIVVFSFLGQKNSDSWEDFKWLDDKDHITTEGAVFIAIASVLVVLDITSLILMLTVISPKAVNKTTNKLESSALSGVKIKYKRTLDKVAAVTQRTEVKDKPKKQHKKKAKK